MEINHLEELEVFCSDPVKHENEARWVVHGVNWARGHMQIRLVYHGRLILKIQVAHKCCLKYLVCKQWIVKVMKAHCVQQGKIWHLKVKSILKWFSYRNRRKWDCVWRLRCNGCCGKEKERDGRTEQLSEYKVCEREREREREKCNGARKTCKDVGSW